MESPDCSRLNKLNPITDEIREQLKLRSKGCPDWICIKCECIVLEYVVLLSTSIESETLLQSVMGLNVEETDSQENINERFENEEDNDVHILIESDTDETQDIPDFKDEPMHEEYLEEIEFVELTNNKTFINSKRSRSKISFDKVGNMLKCNACGKLSGSKKLHNSHVACVHTRPHLCPIKGCGKAFGIPGFVRKHIQQVHSGKKRRKYVSKRALKIIPGQTLEEIVINKSPEPPVECTECGQTFPESSRLTFHMKQVHGEANIPCEICGRLFNEIKLRAHIKIHDPQYECYFCQKKFIEKYMLRRHIQFHHLGITNYVCKKCGKAFESSQRLRMHWLYSHSSLEEKAKLLLKRRQHQPRIKPEHLRGYCQYCSMRFDDKSELIKHVKEHTLVHSCDICSKRFASEVVLQRHLETHKGKQYPFQCGLCDSRYATKSILNKHYTRVHEGRDHHTNKSNRQNSNKSYACFLCEQKFSEGRRLKEHLVATHTQSRYQCPHCAVRCICSRGIVSHLKRDHPGSLEAQPDVNLYFDRDEPTHTKLMEEYTKIFRGGSKIGFTVMVI